MAEWRLTDELVPHVSTADYHHDRERAPHLEQPWHRPRLEQAAAFVRKAAELGAVTWSDLGCGDGGLLYLAQDVFTHAWGYDFQPSNAAGWVERGVQAQALDVFGKGRAAAALGDVVSMTEVLEHVAEPHLTLTRLAIDPRPRFLVCSSPWNEHPGNHSDCHAWAWDMVGYRAMVEDAGWSVIDHVPVGLFQVILAESR
jgi:hypothetical protein